MKYIYYIDGEKFTTNKRNKVPDYISSPDDNTPALVLTETGHKEWRNSYFKIHRLIGPAIIIPNIQKEYFCLNNKHYENVNEWLKDHPNPDLYFDALGMTATDRILWFLQN
jgi:hypothetical protein